MSAGWAHGARAQAEQGWLRIADAILRPHGLGTHRRLVVIGLRGVVVEIGFGSGRNLPLYPEAVEHIYAVDPSAAARRLAAGRIGRSPIPVRFVGEDARHLPFEDGSVDGALSTFTLCSIPDVTRALHELFRVLRPGGTFHFLEHGLAPEPGLARWQHRLSAVQQRLAGGCRLDLPIGGLVRGAGFGDAALHHAQTPGPRLLAPWGYLYEGSASKPA